MADPLFKFDDIKGIDRGMRSHSAVLPPPVTSARVASATRSIRFDPEAAFCIAGEEAATKYAETEDCLLIGVCSLKMTTVALKFRWFYVWHRTFL